MKKLIFASLITVTLVLVLASCTHEHSWGAWDTTKAATCTKEGVQTRYCECGEKETRTITATGHSYAPATCTAPKTCTKCEKTTGVPNNHNYESGICTACDAISETAKSQQLATAKSVFETMKSLESDCDALYNIYYKAWYFVIFESDNYSSYESILNAFCSYTGVDGIAIHNATIEYLQMLGLDTTLLNGLAALRTTSAVMSITEMALSDLGVFDDCYAKVTKAAEDAKGIKSKVVGEDCLQALVDYMNAVADYYGFAKTPTGSLSSYPSSKNTYKNHCISCKTLLSNYL